MPRTRSNTLTKPARASASAKFTARTRVGKRWRYLWRAVDPFGQLIDFRLTAKRNTHAIQAFPRQAQETVDLHHPLTVVTDSHVSRTTRKHGGKVDFCIETTAVA